MNEITDRLDRIERLLVILQKNVLTTAEVALMLNVSESRVRHLTSSHELPHYKKGTKTYFKKQEVEAWQLSERVPSNSEIQQLAATYAATHK